jgi:arginase
VRFGGRGILEFHDGGASLRRVTTILAPYHLDERIGDLGMPADRTVVSSLPPGDPWSRMAVQYDAVADMVADAVRDGQRPTVLSGDCTTALGTVAGLQRAGLDPAIVWFDAHGDVQTPETTTSGYLGGMPLRLLVGHRRDIIADRLGLRDVPEQRVVLVDARDLDPAEADYLSGAAIRRSTVEGLAGDLLPAGPFYLHVDFDVVDPGELPGLLFPAPGGPAFETVASAIRRVLATGRVAALGAACTWHPGRGDPERVQPLLQID